MTDPGAGKDTGRRLGAWLFPLGLLLCLVVGAWMKDQGAATPGWLARALEHAGQVRNLGVDFLGGLDPVSDPRVAWGALLTLAGIPEAWLLPVARIFSLLIVILLLYCLPRLAQDGRAAGGWFLASAPLWIEGILRADPALWVGALFLLMTLRGLPLWLEAGLLGWVLGWSPWAWTSLLFLPLGSLLQPAGNRFRGPAVLLLALAVLWLLNPQALMDPAGWLAGMWRQAAMERLGSVQGHFGVRMGLFPLLGTLHWGGLALLLVAARTWPARVRRGDLAPLVCLLLLFLALRSGFAQTAPLLILLPWAAGEVTRGWIRVVPWFPRVPSAISRWVPLALIVPLALGTIARWQVPAQAVAEQAQVLARVEAQLPPGSLVVHDLGFAAPDSSALLWLAIPFHAIEPGLYRGAYWTGWFRAASAVIVSERMVMRFLRQEQGSQRMIAFYARLTETAEQDLAFGQEPGRRTHVLRFTPRLDEPLGPGWRDQVAAGATGGLPGTFLASLAGALAAAGNPGAAVTLLEEALTAGYDDVGIPINLANALLDLGRINEAGQVLDEATRQHPDEIALRYNLALVLTRAGRWERAARTLVGLRQEWPRSPAVSYLLALSLANSGRPAAARAEVERALALAPAFPERENALELLKVLTESHR